MKEGRDSFSKDFLFKMIDVKIAYWKSKLNNGQHPNPERVKHYITALNDFRKEIEKQ